MDLSVDVPHTESRRRNCIVCNIQRPHTSIVSFTRSPEKQKEWVEILANGDEQFAHQLLSAVSTGRKYLCKDHFSQDRLIHRASGSIELRRHSYPLPYITRKGNKESSNLVKYFNAKMMTILVNMTNTYIDKCMEQFL